MRACVCTCVRVCVRACVCVSVNGGKICCLLDKFVNVVNVVDIAKFGGKSKVCSFFRFSILFQMQRGNR